MSNKPNYNSKIYQGNPCYFFMKYDEMMAAIYKRRPTPTEDEKQAARECRQLARGKKYKEIGISSADLLDDIE